jgi:arginase family enzyme
MNIATSGPFTPPTSALAERVLDVARSAAIEAVESTGGWGPGHGLMRGMRSTFLAVTATSVALLLWAPSLASAQRSSDGDGRLRVALAKQPFSPTGTSAGPTTMADGGIQQVLAGLGAVVRIDESELTPDEASEYGAWKRLGMALGHFADIVARNERDGYFTIGLMATCPSMPGLVAGLQHSGPKREPLKIGMLWLDAHPDFNTPETTRSGSLGGMPVAVATGRALDRMRLDAHLDPPLSDRHVVMAGVRLVDPLEQHLLDQSRIEQLSVDDLRNMTPAVFAQLDRLSQITDKIYSNDRSALVTVTATADSVAGVLAGIEVS